MPILLHFLHLLQSASSPVRADHKLALYAIQLYNILRIRCVKPFCLPSAVLIRDACSDALRNGGKDGILWDMDF